MKKRIYKAIFFPQASFWVVTILLVNTAISFSAPFSENITTVIRFLSTFKNDKSGLHKIAQGQLPAYQSPSDMVPFDHREGLKEAITQYWDHATSLWHDGERDVFTVNDGEIVKVTSYDHDSTLIWKPHWESAFAYHAKGKASSQTIKEYSKSQWIMNSFTTVEYNQIDSPASFSNFEWDSIQNKWDSLHMTSGQIAYNANGKMEEIVATFHYGERSGCVFYTYTYYPDGKFNYEETSITGIFPVMIPPSPGQTRITHFYPDALTEILLSQDYFEKVDTANITTTGWSNNDSTVITYNPAGLVSSSIKYSWSSPGWQPMKQEITTYDANNRPLIRQSLRSYQDGTKNLTNSEQLVFYYENQQVKNPAPGRSRQSGLISGSMLFDRTIFLKGFPQGHCEAFIELYDLKGVKVYTSMIRPINGSISFRMNCILAKGYYSCLIKQGDRRQTLELIKAW
jgi:hypothetical protein